MVVRCDKWPEVIPNDDGIRPAGEPDQCLYCHARIGQLHGQECATVTKLVRYEVFENERMIGYYTTYDPFFWTEYDCNFHKNGSSWCTDNALDDIEYLDPADEERFDSLFPEDSEGCSCSILSFEYDCVVDKGPFITVREEING